MDQIYSLPGNDVTNFHDSSYKDTPVTPSSTPSNPTPKPDIDPELQRLIDAWPILPEAIKAGIVAMVKASQE